MARLIILFILLSFLPSGVVSAYYLARYLSFRMKVLEDGRRVVEAQRRREELREDFEDLLK